MIIDIHGHYTTTPDALATWRDTQLAAFNAGDAAPAEDPVMSDDEIMASIAANQLAQMDARGIDLTVFSPRASFMAHHLGDEQVSQRWARVCNDLVARVAQLFPGRFAPGAMLPQSPGVDPANCVEEFDRAVTELGAVAVNLNPDPSGGFWNSPPLTDRSWYPIYERAVAHDVPLMIHVSTSANPAFHTTGAHYLNADTTAFMQLLSGDLFTDFPQLRLVIPHGGGAAPYHWGRFRGLAQSLGQPEPAEHLLGNVYFDTCVYHQPGIDLLLKVIPTKNVLFASEMIGAVRGVDPDTGRNFDDTGSYVSAAGLSEDELHTVFEGNARRVYPGLDAWIREPAR